MKILIIGSGGREHALAWKLAQEAEVHAAPGNIGMECERHDVSVDDLDGLVALADRLKPDFVLVGPEDPLVKGLGTRLRQAGHVVFGPDANGAQLEASKAFSKAIMAGAGAPTAEYCVVQTEKDALRAVAKFFDAGKQVAVKASGAALGKGVVVAETLDEAKEAVQIMMVDRVFGEAGETLVIEERLDGREFSLITICSENGYWSLPVAQDYKRVFDGDSGPMTGGMGSYSPVEWLSVDVIAETERLVVEPALKFLASQNILYRGALFSGLMLTDGGPQCLEYNVRFGDPETQSIVRRLGAGFAETLIAASKGERPPHCEVFSDVATVTVVLANKGYPGIIAAKPEIQFPERFEPGIEVFHAGTELVGDSVFARGGRVLNVSATGSTLDEARFKAYVAAESIHFDGMHFRRDIAAISGKDRVH